MQDFIRRHGVLIALLLVAPMIITLLYLCYDLLYGNNEIQIRDWLSYSAALLAYFGSLFIGIVSLYQSERANEISRQAAETSERAFEMSQREYLTRFEIINVYYTGFEHEDSSKKYIPMEFAEQADCFMNFSKLEDPANVKNDCRIVLKNIGVHPIVKIFFSKQNGTEISVDVLINTGKEYIVEIIDPELFMAEFNESAKYIISCKNSYGMIGKVTLEIQTKEAYGHKYPRPTIEPVDER